VSDISDKLLKQRLRNRIVESLHVFADEEAVNVIGTCEVIEQWYDYVDDERLSFYNAPVFSSEEIHSIKRFHNCLSDAHKQVPRTWRLEELEGCEAWSKLVLSAREAHAVFMKRGRFDEESEFT